MKNRFKDDYRNVTRMDAGGREVRDYDYIGDFYVLPFDEREKRRTAWMNLFFVAAAAVIQVAAGFLNPDSSHTAWIVFPYFFVYLPLIYAFFGVQAYAAAWVRMQRAHYELGLLRIRRSFYGVFVLAAANVLLDAVYIVIHRAKIRLWTELLYLSMFVLEIAVVVAFGRFYDRRYGGITVEKAS